jgi:hypothetical protein
MDSEEYDERMSTLLWQEVNKDDDLLDFAYYFFCIEQTLMLLE